MDEIVTGALIILAAVAAVAIAIAVVRSRAPQRRSAHPELVRYLAGRTIAEVAPEQEQLFPSLADVYLSDPQRVMSRRRRRKDPLGFGMPPLDDVLMIGIVVWVADKMVGELIGKATSSGFERFRSWLRRLFRRRTATLTDTRTDREVTFALRQADAAEARRIVLARLAQTKIDANKAERLADAMVLALLTVPLPADTTPTTPADPAGSHTPQGQQ